VLERRISGPDRDWLTLDQCAEWIGVSPDTLEREIDSGRFPPGVEVSKKNKRWGWLDCVAYMHLLGRLKTSEQPESTKQK